ncbi:MAG: nucleotidyl transferase AbiEii/AbiGii toxin family protein [Bacteroidales bacterium]|nr:nucleotidyl transferase AbiEii/AbiGii toxin family protein [Bacteroidales bacterium]
MLYYETLEKPTLELLKKLMADYVLNDFVLVGGTALALRLGHRKSVDIDLFTNQPFKANQLAEHLQHTFEFAPDFMAENTVKGEINGIIVDSIAHQYPWIENYKSFDGIRLAGLKDIAAMKLNAISGNGTRLKDFIDVATLSTKLSLNEMLHAYQQKYSSNPVIALKSIVYFDDINFNEPILMVDDKSFKWEKIETRLFNMVHSPKKLFKAI